mmetsp:Transcript_28035/g.70014  ORF Transcript_28035/g.70014 Transcript_28035/m.70014 type:complete len:281 (-) Transcript_28035:457-1299(-)
MAFGEEGEVVLHASLGHHFVVECVCPEAREVHGERRRHQRKYRQLLSRVIQHLALGAAHARGSGLCGVGLCGAVHVHLHGRELTANRRITSGDDAGLCEVQSCPHDELLAGVGHGAVHHLVVADLLVVALLVHRRIPGEQVSSGDADVLELHGAVVHAVVPQLLTNVEQSHALDGLVCVEVPHLKEKWMRAVVLAPDFESGHADAVGARLGQAAWPPFGRRERRRVEHPLLRAFVVIRRRLKTGDVGSVCEFGLRVCSDDAEVAGQRHPPIALLVVGQAL